MVAMVTVVVERDLGSCCLSLLDMLETVKVKTESTARKQGPRFQSSLSAKIVMS